MIINELCCHPAMEPVRRNHAAVAAHPVLGQLLHRTDAGSGYLLSYRQSEKDS
jgi:hypothetical protein